MGQAHPRKHVLQAHGGTANCICMVSPHVLASGHQDAVVRLWDLRTRECAHSLQINSHWPFGVRHLCMASDRILAVALAYDWGIELWDVGECVFVRMIDEHEDIANRNRCPPRPEVRCMCAVAMNVLAVGYCDATICLWHVSCSKSCTAPAAILRGHTRSIASMCMVSDNLLVSSAQDGTICVWNVVTSLIGQKTEIGAGVGEQEEEQKEEQQEEQQEEQEEEKRVEMRRSARRGAHVRVRLSARVPSVTSTLYGLCPVSHGVFVGYTTCGHDRALRLAHIKGREARCMHVYESVVCVCAVSAGIVAIGLMSGDVELWDVVTGKHKARLRGHSDPVTSVCAVSSISRRSLVIATASEDGTVCIWEAVDLGKSKYAPFRLYGGDCFVDYAILPSQRTDVGAICHRRTYSRAAFEVVKCNLDCNKQRTRSHGANAYMGVPPRAITCIEDLLG